MISDESHLRRLCKIAIFIELCLLPLTVIANSYIIVNKPELVLQGVKESPPPEPLQALDPLVARIIQCESGGNPNAQNPHSSAYGLCQYLDSSWEYVKNKWNIELDRHSYDDQLYACKRLLEEEGCRHWRESASCHGCYE